MKVRAVGAAEAGRRISRTEALQIARQTLERAEQERAKEREMEFHETTDEEVIAMLRQEMADLRQQLETMMAARDTLNEACTILINDRDWFRTRLEEAQQQLVDLRQQLATVTAERDATQAQVTRLREALEDVIRAEVALANLGFYRSHEDGKSYRIARAALRETESTEQPVQVIVNGKEHTVSTPTLTYEQVVELAATGRSSIHSVTYHTAGLVGSLIPGKSVKVRPRMIFNAYVTDNA